MGPTINYSQVDDGTPPAEFEIATSMPAPKLSFFQRIKQSLINLAFNNRETGRGKPRALGRVIGRHNTRSNKNDPGPRWFTPKGIWREPVPGETVYVVGPYGGEYIRLIVGTKGTFNFPEGHQHEGLARCAVDSYTLTDPR